MLAEKGVNPDGFSVGYTMVGSGGLASNVLCS